MKHLRGWLIGVAVLVLGCYGAAQAITPRAPQSVLPVETVPVVPSATGTATLDYSPTLTQAAAAVETAQADSFIAQQAAVDARETAVALGVEAARITEQARWDAETEVAQVVNWTAAAQSTSVALTSQSGSSTATAFPTMAYLMKRTLDDREKQREHEQAQPTRALLMAQIESESKYGGWRIFGTILVGSVFLAAVVLVGWLLVRPEKSREDSEVLDLPKIGPVIEPTFERTDFGKWERVDPIIPCTAEQLADFAEAVVDGERQFGVHGALALAFGPREGYILFREWLAGNGFTEPAARAGEVQPSQRGLAFLREVVTTGSPPPPYVFRVNDGEQPGRSVPYTVYSGGGVGEDV